MVARKPSRQGRRNLGGLTLRTRLFVALLISCAHPTQPVSVPTKAVDTAPPVVVRECVDLSCPHGSLAYAWASDAALAFACGNHISLVEFPSLFALGTIDAHTGTSEVRWKGSRFLAALNDDKMYELDFAARALRPSRVMFDDASRDPTGRVAVSVSAADELVLTEDSAVRTLPPHYGVSFFAPDGNTIFARVAAPNGWSVPWMRAYDAHTGAVRRDLEVSDLIPAHTADAVFYSLGHTIVWLDLKTGGEHTLEQSEGQDTHQFVELSASHDDRWLMARMGMFKGNSVLAVDVRKRQPVVGDPSCLRQE